LGSGPGPADGVTFTSTSRLILALTTADWNFRREPERRHGLYFVANSQVAVMDVPLGFTPVLPSSMRSSATPSRSTSTADRRTGTLLQTLALPVTGTDLPRVTRLAKSAITTSSVHLPLSESISPARRNPWYSPKQRARSRSTLSPWEAMSQGSRNPAHSKCSSRFSLPPGGFPGDCANFSRTRASDWQS